MIEVAVSNVCGIADSPSGVLTQRTKTHLFARYSIYFFQKAPRPDGPEVPERNIFSLSLFRFYTRSCHFVQYRIDIIVILSDYEFLSSNPLIFSIVYLRIFLEDNRYLKLK